MTPTKILTPLLTLPQELLLLLSGPLWGAAASFRHTHPTTFTPAYLVENRGPVDTELAVLKSRLLIGLLNKYTKEELAKEYAASFVKVVEALEKEYNLDKS